MSEEGKEVAWNVVRACFYLLAGIIWAQIILGYFVWGACAYGIFIGKLQIGACKDLTPNVMELMVGGMAVVIAFSGRTK